MVQHPQVLASDIHPSIPHAKTLQLRHIATQKFLARHFIQVVAGTGAAPSLRVPQLRRPKTTSRQVRAKPFATKRAGLVRPLLVLPPIHMRAKRDFFLFKTF